MAFWTRLWKEKPLGTVGGIITLLLLLTGILADYLAPHGMNDVFLAERLSPPSPKFWLGTDNMGRDLLSRLIYGARISVIVGLAASAVAGIINLVVGMISGYVRGRLDLILQRLVDTLQCVPSLPLMMVVVSLVGPGIPTLIAVLGVVWGIGGSRIIRGSVISIRENVFVKAAVAAGCSTPRVLVRHVFPHLMPSVIVLFTLHLPAAILAEASLSFLGFGVPPPTPSWGGMLSGSGRKFMFLAPWMVIWPGLVLSVVVYGVQMFGDAVRDILDPRLKGRAGRYGVKAQKQARLETVGVGRPTGVGSVGGRRDSDV